MFLKACGFCASILCVLLDCLCYIACSSKKTHVTPLSREIRDTSQRPVSKNQRSITTLTLQFHYLLLKFHHFSSQHDSKGKSHHPSMSRYGMPGFTIITTNKYCTRCTCKFTCGTTSSHNYTIIRSSPSSHHSHNTNHLLLQQRNHLLLRRTNHR